MFRIPFAYMLALGQGSEVTRRVFPWLLTLGTCEVQGPELRLSLSRCKSCGEEVCADAVVFQCEDDTQNH